MVSSGALLLMVSSHWSGLCSMLYLLSYVGLGLFKVTKPGADAWNGYHLGAAAILRELNRKCARAQEISGGCFSHGFANSVKVGRGCAGDPPCFAHEGQSSASATTAAFFARTPGGIPPGCPFSRTALLGTAPGGRGAWQIRVQAGMWVWWGGVALRSPGLSVNSPEQHQAVAPGRWY